VVQDVRSAIILAKGNYRSITQHSLHTHNHNFEPQLNHTT
jgi:hypothetical protein